MTTPCPIQVFFPFDDDDDDDDDNGFDDAFALGAGEALRFLAIFIVN